MKYPECLTCDCTFKNGCKLEDKDGTPKKRQYIIKTPRTRRGPYRLAKKRANEMILRNKK